MDRHHLETEPVGIAFQGARELARQISRAETERIRYVSSKTSFAAGVERFVRSDPAFAVTIEQWDQDPFLLGTPSGTVDLRTGLLRTSEPSEGITRGTATAPAETAECPLWIHFLTDATGGDEELIRFLQLCGGEGLIAELVCVEKEGGRISSQVLLLGAGVETTTHLISGSVYEVLRAPNLRDWLREDWGRATLRRSETEPPGFSDWSMKRWRSPRAASQDWA